MGAKQFFCSLKINNLNYRIMDIYARILIYPDLLPTFIA